MAPDDLSSTSSLQHLLRVDVAGHHWGLPVEDVLQVHAAVHVAPLPDAPAVVVGLVNHRGRPVPVLDLRRSVGEPAQPVRVDDHLVVLRLPDRDVSLLVDAAVDVISVPAEAVDRAVTATGALRTHGVVVLAGGLLVVLDAAAFLSSAEASTLDQAVDRALAAASA